jgi:molecular chaperone GrpE
MEDKEVLNKTEEEINNTEDSTEAETAETATDEVKADETKEGADTSEEKAGEEATADAGADAKTGSGSGSKPDKADKKKKKSDKKTEALQIKIDELEDRVKRQMAEFDNFRKRTEKEKSQMFETGAKSVIEKILPVVDNFERGLATVPEDEATSPFAEGMNMIYKQLMDELDKMDVKPIEALGCEFDPDLHNAVMQVESEEYESGIIAQELQKGYTYRGSVVRHSMVAVVP